MKAVASSYSPSLVDDICRWGYSLVLVLLIPFAFITLMRRGAFRNKNYNKRRFERFGIVAHPPKQNGYLFHCVSVGEVVAASCVIKRIMESEPDTQITITTTTPTGSARVRSIFADKVHHFYLPFDLHMAMAGMIKRVRPKAVLITEVELWPNLIHACWKRAIPVIVVNARMTDRSARSYKKIGRLFTPMLHKVSHVCAQGERDFNNYLSLGIDRQKLTLTNNIKFDQVGATQSKKLPFMELEYGDRQVLVAGSTHDTEEEAIVHAVQLLRKKGKAVTLVIVPRHPERFDTVAKLLSKMGEDFVRTSEQVSLATAPHTILLDEMGKLNQAYQIENFAFVGGSLADKGGHNALEPAAWSIPIMMGPNTYNNPVICEYLKDQGALSIVANWEDIHDKVASWLENPESAIQTGSAGRRVLDDNLGAVELTLEKIAQFV